jgi:hypothetical protein
LRKRRSLFLRRRRRNIVSGEQMITDVKFGQLNLSQIICLNVTATTENPMRLGSKVLPSLHGLPSMDVQVEIKGYGSTTFMNVLEQHTKVASLSWSDNGVHFGGLAILDKQQFVVDSPPAFSPPLTLGIYILDFTMMQLEKGFEITDFKVEAGAKFYESLMTACVEREVKQFDVDSKWDELKKLRRQLTDERYRELENVFMACVNYLSR